MPHPVYDGGPSDPFADIKAMLNDLSGVAEGSRSSTRGSSQRYATETRIPSHFRDVPSSYSFSNAAPQYRTEERVPRGERSHHRTEERVPRGGRTPLREVPVPHYRTQERVPRGERSHHRTEERVPREHHTRAEFRDSQGNWHYEYTHTYHSSSSSSQPPPQPRRTYTARPRTPPSSSSSSSSDFSSGSSSYSQDEYDTYEYSTHSRPRAPSPPPSSSRDKYYSQPRPRPRARSPSPPPPPPAHGTKPRKGLYAVLGVSRSATAAEIKKAHRAMSLKWHPDRCGEGMKDKATEMMAEINQANDVLGDVGKRAYYDRTGLMQSDL